MTYWIDFFKKKFLYLFHRNFGGMKMLAILKKIEEKVDKNKAKCTERLTKNML